jgi:hypothetical protein
MTDPFRHLPDALADIAAAVADATGDPAAGLRAALAMARARGGQRIYVRPVAEDNPWLLEAVGLATARLITAYLCAGQVVYLDLPIAGTRGRSAERQQRRAIIAAGLAAQLPIDEIAAAAGVSRRFVFWVQARLRAREGSPQQLDLFRGEAA